MIENYQSQIMQICNLLEIALMKYVRKCHISDYNPFILKSGISMFDKTKIYIDTSSVEGINRISSSEVITISKRPSRANMQPVAESIWFAKMKGANKIILITKEDDDLIDKHILSTGFLGIKATDNLPLSLLTAIVVSKDFSIQRDLNSVGTTMAGVNNETFTKIQVPYLVDDEIKEFDIKYFPLVRRLSYLRKELNSLKKIKGNLLNKYF